MILLFLPPSLCARYPLVDLESSRAQFVEIFYAINAALTEGDWLVLRITM